MPDARPDEPPVVTPPLLREWPLPDPDGSKDAKGRLLVVGGSDRTPGAVLLAAEAALRVGAGKVQVATTASTAAHLATAVPEAFVVGLDADDGEIATSAAEQILELADGADAVLAGPGIGDPAAACALLEAFVPHLDDGARRRRARHGVPHGAPRRREPPGGPNPVDAQRHRARRDAPRGRVGCRRRPRGHPPCRGATGVTVLSGSEVSYVVEADGRAWRVEVGSPGTAVAGSGDVKAGAVAGLLARGATPAQAAAWGAYLHGRAGERLTASVGRVGFLAREVAGELAHALAEVEA